MRPERRLSEPPETRIYNYTPTLLVPKATARSSENASRAGRLAAYVIASQRGFSGADTPGLKRLGNTNKNIFLGLR